MKIERGPSREAFFIAGVSPHSKLKNVIARSRELRKFRPQRRFYFAKFQSGEALRDGDIFTYLATERHNLQHRLHAESTTWRHNGVGLLQMLRKTASVPEHAIIRTPSFQEDYFYHIYNYIIHI